MTHRSTSMRLDFCFDTDCQCLRCCAGIRVFQRSNENSREWHTLAATELLDKWICRSSDVPENILYTSI